MVDPKVVFPNANPVAEFKEVEVLEGKPLRKYKVATIWKYAAFATVKARSQNEAARLVIEKSQGRPAGEAGPELQGVAVKEIDLFEKEDDDGI